MDKALPVVICVVRSEGKLLLIKRLRGAYPGLLGLPGGKIEKDEHLSEAALREIEEETSLSCTFKDYLGTVSELYYEDGILNNHFLLHVCELLPMNEKVVSQNEGEVDWFELDSLNPLESQIILSDFKIIEHFVQKTPLTRYIECVMEKNNSEYSIKKFRPPK